MQIVFRKYRKLLVLLGIICLFGIGRILIRFSIGGNGQPYHRQMPLIFIGGVPRSGTTLIRAMLDAHPDVRCGQETHVIPLLLQMRSRWMKSELFARRLEEAGVTKEVLDSAIAQFILEVIVKHGEPAHRLCNKDPMTLQVGSYMIDLFPNAKFLFMVRDGRATAHSIYSRNITIRGINTTDYRSSISEWNRMITKMHSECKEIGSEKCMMVYYEQLVLHPEDWMRKILKFLDVPWNDSVLHHEEFINKPNGVSLSKVERSTDQVIKPVNLEALTKWVGQIPEDVVRDMADIAPMLSVLGYDPYGNPPDYGNADSWVEADKQLWKTRAERIQRRNDVQPDEYPNVAEDGIADTADAVNNNNYDLHAPPMDDERTFV